MSESQPTEVKVCPECRSEVHAEATRCKHCAADLRPPHDWDQAKRGVGLLVPAILAIMIGTTNDLEWLSAIGILVALYGALSILSDVIDARRRR